MKASNKYLFNQKVDCDNCKHSKSIDNLNDRVLSGDWCDIHLNSEGWCLWLCSSMRTNNVAGEYKSCGPLGKFYEPKSKQ